MPRLFVADRFFTRDPTPGSWSTALAPNSRRSALACYKTGVLKLDKVKATPVEPNFFYMLAGLLTLFVALPVLQAFPKHIALVSMYTVLAVTLGLSAWSLSRSRTAFVIGASLAVLSTVLAIVGIRAHHPLLAHLVFGLHLTFWLIGAWFTARVLLAPGAVDLNRIVGSVCLYLIAGFIWTFLYFFQNLMAPGSFKGLSAEALYEELTEFAYQSFVTLTTLGYGDITPAAPIARALVNLEAIFGQFYIAILVAGLVGVRISSRVRGA